MKISHNNKLHNIFSKDILLKKLENEDFPRTTISFYRYTQILNPSDFRNYLYSTLSDLKVLGRIYIASEGINAQISLPSHNMDTFRSLIQSVNVLKDIPFKIAIEDKSYSFLKLIIKVKSKIVADGLPDNTFDTSNVGRHLNAKEFNELLESPNSIVVDMRNQYESEIGHFEGAILPDADTFREELPMVAELLKGKENVKILLYCTGGIRCEKASAYLKYKGFQDVNQLYGGIIAYTKEVKELNLKNKFHGKNFVFDERLGERITDEIISNCHICGNKSDRHINCANDACHILFIQCEECSNKMMYCCSDYCKEVLQWSPERQLEERRKKSITHTHHTRLRKKINH